MTTETTANQNKLSEKCPFCRELAAHGDVLVCIHSECEHEFTGWREIDGGRGGERVCKKCGLGAMARSLRTGI